MMKTWEKLSVKRAAFFKYLERCRVLIYIGFPSGTYEIILNRN